MIVFPINFSSFRQLEFYQKLFPMGTGFEYNKVAENLPPTPDEYISAFYE